MDTDNSIQMLMDVIEALEMSPGAQAQLTTFINNLTDRSKSQFEPFLTFILQYVEYNRSKYLQMQIELGQISQELQVLKADLQQFLIAYRNVTAATAANTPVPFVVQLARPTEAPFVAPPDSRPSTNPASDSPLTVNVDGTVSRKMDQVSNSVMVTFSSTVFTLV